MSEESRSSAGEAAKVEVRVGRWTPDGTFTGETLRFAGEEVGAYTDYSLATSRADRGVSYTLYRSEAPEGRYRVHEFEWSNWQGEESEAFLYPTSSEEGVPDEFGVYPPVEYSSYTEEEARLAWPQLFAALGMPNTRDIG